MRRKPLASLDASAVDCRVFTFKEGALSALAHDLELKATRLTLEIAELYDDQREQEPGGIPEKWELRARIAADSLIVLHAVKDGEPTPQLSPSDKRKIEKTLTGEVLDVRRYPEISYEASALVGEGALRFALAGELTLQGRRRSLALTAELRDGRVRAEATLHQPDFGIQPYSALFGALKIRPEVKVRISMAWPLPPTSP